MTDVELLLESGSDLVKEHEEFPQETGSTPPTDQLRNHITRKQVEEASVDLEALDKAIEQSLAVFDLGRRKERTAMDSNLAPIVRQCIQIPRRVAAQPGFWHHLTLLRYPEFIDARWNHADDLQEKYLGDQKDLYSNHMARLWWGAELTYDEEAENYLPTHRLFNKQRLVNYLLDSSFRRYRPAAIAFAVELWDDIGTDITAIASRFNNSLSTIQLESRSKDDIQDQLVKIRRRIDS